LAVESASRLVHLHGWLALLTTETELAHLRQLLESGWSDFELHALPGSNRRVLALTQREVSFLG